MNKLARHLTEKEQDIFVEHFYILDGSPNDLDSPSPWGAPWQYNPEVDLEGETIEKMASNYFDTVIDEINELVEAETWD